MTDRLIRANFNSLFTRTAPEAVQQKLDDYVAATGVKKSWFICQAVAEKLQREKKK